MKCNFLFTRTLNMNLLNKKTTAGIFWGNTGKTTPSQTGPKSACYKASVNNSHAPSFFNLWGLRENNECRLCKRSHPVGMLWPESLDHIHWQARYPVLRKPRISLRVHHHGIWRELLTAISRNSLETHDNSERKCYFPSAVSEATHDEWTARQILVNLGLFSGIRRLSAEVATFHARQNITLTLEEITFFYGRRPDGVTFNAKGKQCVFLEFTWPG